MSEMLAAVDESAALEQLHEIGCTDGLPVVIPTEPRVARMVLASGLDAEMVLGEMGPAGGVATMEKVAIAAVMAGCLPDYMPIVVAAVKAVIDPRFDLTEMQATTHCTANTVPRRTDHRSSLETVWRPPATLSCETTRHDDSEVGTAAEICNRASARSRRKLSNSPVIEGDNAAV